MLSNILNRPMLVQFTKFTTAKYIFPGLYIFLANSIPGIKHRHATSVFLINEFDLAIFAELYLSEPELFQLGFK